MTTRAAAARPWPKAITRMAAAQNARLAASARCAEPRCAKQPNSAVAGSAITWYSSASQSMSGTVTPNTSRR